MAKQACRNRIGPPAPAPAPAPNPRLVRPPPLLGRYPDGSARNVYLGNSSGSLPPLCVCIVQGEVEVPDRNRKGWFLFDHGLVMDLQVLPPSVSRPVDRGGKTVSTKGCKGCIAPGQQQRTRGTAGVVWNEAVDEWNGFVSAQYHAACCCKRCRWTPDMHIARQMVLYIVYDI